MGSSEIQEPGAPDLPDSMSLYDNDRSLAFNFNKDLASTWQIPLTRRGATYEEPLSVHTVYLSRRVWHVYVISVKRSFSLSLES